MNIHFCDYGAVKRNFAGKSSNFRIFKQETLSYKLNWVPYFLIPNTKIIPKFQLVIHQCHINVGHDIIKTKVLC